MLVYRSTEMEKTELVPGAEAGFVHTENVTLAYWSFAPGVSIPEHAHPHEQVVNVIDGIFELTVGGETERLEAGAVVVIPPDVSHSGTSVTACRLIDVFHPVREDYR